MKLFTRWTLAGALTLAGSACTANVHDNQFNIKDPRINVSAKGDVQKVDPDDGLQFHLDAGNVFLVEPNQTPPADQAVNAGHFQVYLDSVDTPPILVTARTDVEVRIPAGTSVGVHKLIFRLHAHDGRPLQAVLEVEINVTVQSDGAPSGQPGTCDCATPSTGDGQDRSNTGAPDAAMPATSSDGGSGSGSGNADAGTAGHDDDDDDHPDATAASPDAGMTPAADASTSTSADAAS